jgi:molecular chaperone DnaK (HSP70)
MTQLSEIINHNNLDDKLIVFSVPSFFTEMEKKALLNAASISGYKNVKINSDTVSLGLDYGSYKKS